MAKILVLESQAISQMIEIALQANNHETIFSTQDPVGQIVLDMQISLAIVKADSQKDLLLVQEMCMVIPVVALTTNLKHFGELCNQAGVKIVLQKPFHIADLLTVVEANLPK